MGVVVECESITLHSIYIVEERGVHKVLSIKPSLFYMLGRETTAWLMARLLQTCRGNNPLPGWCAAPLCMSGRGVITRGWSMYHRSTILSSSSKQSLKIFQKWYLISSMVLDFKKLFKNSILLQTKFT